MNTPENMPPLDPYADDGEPSEPENIGPSLAHVVCISLACGMLGVLIVVAAIWVLER